MWFVRSGGRGCRARAAETLTHDHCPLCSTALSKERSNGAHEFEKLQELDRDISKTKQAIGEVLKELARLQGEQTEARRKVDDVKGQVDAFEEENEITMLNLRKMLTQAGGVDTLLVSYRAQLDSLLREKREAEERRTFLKADLASAQRELQKQYLSVEQEFVPTFTRLAHLFLGMDLEVKMDSSELNGVNLVVEVRGTADASPTTSLRVSGSSSISHYGWRSHSSSPKHRRKVVFISTRRKVRSTSPMRSVLVICSPNSWARVTES